MEENETATSPEPETPATPTALAGLYVPSTPDGTEMVVAPDHPEIVEPVEPAPAAAETTAAPPEALSASEVDSLRRSADAAAEVRDFVREKAAVLSSLPGEPSSTAQEAIERVLRPDFAGVLEVGAYKLQFGFMAAAAMEERFGSFEAMSQRVDFQGDPAAALLALVDASEVCLRGALLRHQPDVTDDQLEDLYEHLGDFNSVLMLCGVIFRWWRDHDGIGSYIAGIDPTVTLGEETYTLKWGLRALRHYAQHLQGIDLNAIPIVSYLEVLRAMLLRFHGDLVGPGMKSDHLAATLLDDLGLVVGLGGLRRIMAGAEQPKRPQPAGPETQPPSPAEGGTGPAS